MAYTEIGDFPRAVSAAKNAVRTQNIPTNRLLLAHVLARAGNQNEAERLIRELQTSKNGRYLCPYEVGTAYVSLHRKKEAYKWLKKAVSDRVDCMIYLQTEPWMDSLRHDAEYQQLLTEMNLPLH
jgi:predicted Zn-dependent protease